MDSSQSSQPIRLPTSSGDLIHAALVSVVEAGTGVATREPSEHIRTGSRLIRAALQGRFATQFAEEFRKAQSEGRINDDFASSEEGRHSVYEMFEFFDTASPDKATYEFMRNLFFATATSTTTEQDRLLSREMLRIARQLSYPEIAIIIACGQSKGLGRIGSQMGFHEWARHVALDSGLRHEHIVHRAHSRMTDLGLTYPVTKSEIQITDGGNGLTTLGKAMYTTFADYEKRS